jgi:hypothetical protein
LIPPVAHHAVEDDRGGTAVVDLLDVVPQEQRCDPLVTGEQVVAMLDMKVNSGGNVASRLAT